MSSRSKRKAMRQLEQIEEVEIGYKRIYSEEGITLQNPALGFYLKEVLEDALSNDVVDQIVKSYNVILQGIAKQANITKLLGFCYTEDNQFYFPIFNLKQRVIHPVETRYDGRLCKFYIDVPADEEEVEDDDAVFRVITDGTKACRSFARPDQLRERWSICVEFFASARTLRLYSDIMQDLPPSLLSQIESILDEEFPNGRPVYDVV